MRITRYRSMDGAIRWGAEQMDGTAAPLVGGLFESLSVASTHEPMVQRLAPLEPRAIFGIGLNYRAHAEETGRPAPERPVIFMKNPAAVQDPGAPICIPKVCQDPPQVDWEAELAVIIGRPARDVPLASALDYVLGYTAANDISARYWQREGGGGQFVRGKSFDTFCPLGPSIVTADEVPDPQDLTLECCVNGEVVQSGSTSDMVFSVAELIAFMSQGTTLLPGTVILTGTPSGVGVARTPPRFLSPGDQVEVRIGGFEPLTNPVTAG